MVEKFSVDMQTFPSEFVRQYKTLSESGKAKWLAERHRALTDHLYLAYEVMGMDFQEVPHKWLFDKMLKKKPGTPLYDLDLIKKKRLILWSRGTFKTSSIIVEITQLILNYPNIRICFLSGGDELAKLQLQRVKKVFEQPTKKFRELFPEYCCNTLMGNMSQFTVPCRTNTTFAEPTMKISSARSVKASQHFDCIFVDDLVNDSNYRNMKMLQKSIQDYRDICPMLAPDGFMYVTGTRYSFGDLYENIQELIEEEVKKLGTNPWIVTIKSCWVRICQTCGHKDIEHDFDSNLIEHPCAMDDGCKQFVDSGNKGVLFPKFRCRDGRTEGHSVEFLQAEQIRLGAEFFSCQYENNPFAEGEQTFTEELIGKQTLWHDYQFPTAMQAPCFIQGDLSYVGDDKRDLSVLYVVRYYMGQLYQVDCAFGKWDSWETAQQLFALIMKHRPVMIWLERFLGWEAYNTVFEIFARDRGIQKFPVDWLKMNQSEGAKKVRIGGIKGVLSQRRLWLNGRSPGYDKLCEQLKKWPKLGRHDDFADCLGLVCEAPSGYHMDKLPSAADATNTSFLRKLHETPENDDTDVRVAGSY